MVTCTSCGRVILSGHKDANGRCNVCSAGNALPGVPHPNTVGRPATGNSLPALAYR